METSTIAAISTPVGSGGVGIIKISGPDSLKTIAAIFHPGKFSSDPIPVPVLDPSFFSPWRIYYGHIVDPDQQRVYDEVVVAVMPGPKSYTREDVVEVQAHGGIIILENILSLLVNKGIQIAQPGEFTRRAFLNGRIDLTQAEAVIDLINARSDASVEIAFSQASGKLSSSIEPIRLHIIEVLATIEAMIDFPDAVESELDPVSLLKTLSEKALTPVLELISSYEESKSICEGFQVVIAGSPNVGKSSLLNALSRSDRSIVTDQPGTTRDYIETELLLGGLPITLVDTAGLRNDPDPVEKVGIQKSYQRIQGADLVLLVIDASSAATKQETLFFESMKKEKNLSIVLNKIDTISAASRPEVPLHMRSVPMIETSATCNIGIDTLKNHIASASQIKNTFKPNKPVPNFRHKTLLLGAHDSLRQAIENLENNLSLELVSIDLRQAHDLIGEISGSHASPDVLDQIFSRFCIGK